MESVNQVTDSDKGKLDVDQQGAGSDVEETRSRSSSISRAKTIGEQYAVFTSHKELLPIQVHSEAEAEELAEIAKTSNRLWVVCAPPSKSEGDEEDEDSTAKAAVLFRFMRCIQSPALGGALRVLSLSNSRLVGEGAKVLAQVLRDSQPPLTELLLNNVGLTLSQLAELSLAAVESMLQRLSLSNNELPSEAGLPLASLIRRSRRLKFLDVSCNQMRAKGILDLIVAARDREIASRKSPDDETVMLEVSSLNVVVTFNRSATGGAAMDSGGMVNVQDQFAASNVELGDMGKSTVASLDEAKEFQLIVSDNTLSANETAVLILTDLKETAVVGVPETAGSFTGPNEKNIVTGFKEPDPREARAAMKQQVEKVLDSGDGGQGAVTVSTMEEALMLAQVLASVKRATVHMQFNKGNKHAVRADFIDAFLAGSSDNSMLQGLSFRGAGIGGAEIVPIAKALNWHYPLIIRKLDLQSNAIGIAGARDLHHALKSNRTLTTLDISNNGLGPDGCKLVLEAIKNHPLLDRLSMSSNLMRAEGASCLKEVLTENKSLRRLDLRANKLGPKGASFVARALAASRGLHRIDVAENGVRTAGLVEILNSLSLNGSLFRLDVRNNVVAPASVEPALVSMLSTNKCAVLVDISGTTLQVTPAIEVAMAKNYTIRSLGAGVTSPVAVQIFNRNLANRVLLEEAVSRGDIARAQELLPLAPLGYYDRKTLLHFAVSGGPAIMRLLLAVPSISTQAASKDRKGQTALHEAAIQGSTDSAHLLLQAGAVPDIRDWAGKNAADLTSSEQFKRLMAAESSFVLAFRQRNIDAVGSGSYYENSSGLKSPLQAWQSPRPVEFGSRFTNSTEPSHPFKYLVDQVAPPNHRTGRFSLDQLQKMRDLVVFAVLIAWMYELLEIPFRWGFAPNPLPGGYWALALFMDILFMAWFAWTLAGHRTSWDPDSDSSEFGWLWENEQKEKDPLKHPKELASRRAKRRKRFLRDSSFIIMLLAAIPWDFVLFIIWCASGDTHFINPIVLDVIQGLRIMRCGVVFISQNHFMTVAGAFNLSWSFLDMSKMAIWFFYLINFFSCIYFFSGRIAIRYNQPSWLTIATFLDVTPGTLPTMPVFVQYQFTMYFVCFGITNSPFFQNNWFEAFLWVAEFLGLGLVFVAFVFGVIIDRIGQLREERAALQDCQDKIVEICDDLGLPDKVERKIVKKWLSMGSHGLSVEINSIGEMIAPLSKDLRKEVTLHVIWSWISTWEERRRELQEELDMDLVEYELEKMQLTGFRKDVSLPAPFPFTVFFHTWVKKLCFHPERYISYLVKIMQSIDQKFLIADSVLYDFEDPASHIYMVLKGNVTLRLGRTRTGKENVEAQLYPGDWFGWEALGGFGKRKDGSQTKPPRRTFVKANRNTTLYVVPASKFRKLYLQDEEAKFDLDDSWLSNIDAEVLAWTLHHFPPTKLQENVLVTALENPLEQEQMKRVLLRSIVQRGERDKTTKKGVDAALKILNSEVMHFKKTTASELDMIRSQNIALKESLQKQLSTITELLQQLGAKAVVDL